MEQNTKRIEVSTIDGQTLFTLVLTEKETPGTNGNHSTDPKKSAPKGEKTQTNSQTGEVPMTDPQKRYLFRILADQGIEREKATERLKELFQVTSLKDVTKLEASRMIEQLLVKE